jgi:SAM-dependent methyltransferase
MYEPNVQRVLQQLAPSDVVLDVGGWACPFNRANYVLDAEPFDTRGFYRTFGGAPSQGGPTEHFTRETWIQQDLCGEPFPFPDRFFDFVICSHTLEDLRDPLWVCREMMRVGKRGYIEVPSRAAESSRGWEHPRIAGLSHHRWLIDIEGTRIAFLMKLHRLHSHWRLSLPASYFRGMTEEARVQWLFWEGGFTAEEVTIHGLGPQEAELERFVGTVRPYPRLWLALDAAWRRTTNLAWRGWRAGRRRLRG